MNSNNNIFNKSEVENKLKDFKEGQDYSILPTDEPNIKTYNFHNDKLRSMFRDDRVPVRVTREAYDGKDYTYRGHFEEGKDYYYSRQDWHYGENYQGKRGTDFFGNGEWGDFMNGIKWDEHYRESSPDKWEVGWIYRGKDSYKESLIGRIEPEKIEPSHDLKWKHNQLTDKLNSLLSRPESEFGVNGKEKKECEIAGVRKDIAETERLIEKEKGDSNFGSKLTGCCNCGFKGIRPSDNYCMKCGAELCDKVKSLHSNLEKENQELRQQLTEVQKQLAEVLEELKKLKSNASGKGSEKLNQQIAHNEKLVKDSENVSVAEVKEQVQKSQSLMNELNTTASTNKDNKGNGSLPYIIGGSVILAVAGIIGYLVVRKNKRNK